MAAAADVYSDKNDVFRRLKAKLENKIEPKVIGAHAYEGDVEAPQEKRWCPGHPKNAHLKQLDRAPENLHLFKADLLDSETLIPAVQGCQGVFHLATPVPEDKILHPEREMLDPAVKGTLNVLKICSTLKVHKIVVMSSNAAVTSNPNWPQDTLKDESCWSDKEFCKENEDWYSVAKTMAEQEALEYAQNNGLNVVTLCPPFVFGPMLQSTVNASSKLLIYIIKVSSMLTMKDHYLVRN